MNTKVRDENGQPIDMEDLDKLIQYFVKNCQMKEEFKTVIKAMCLNDNTGYVRKVIEKMCEEMSKTYSSKKDFALNVLGDFCRNTEDPNVWDTLMRLDSYIQKNNSNPKKRENAIEAKDENGKTIYFDELDNAITFLERCYGEGKNVYIDFNGHRLYSDCSNLEIYDRLYGMGKTMMDVISYKVMSDKTKVLSKAINEMYMAMQKEITTRAKREAAVGVLDKYLSNINDYSLSPLDFYNVKENLEDIKSCMNIPNLYYNRDENRKPMTEEGAIEATDAPQFLNRFEEYNEIIALEDALKYLKEKHKAGENVYIKFGNVILDSCRDEFRSPYVVWELVKMPIEGVNRLDDAYLNVKTPEERMEIRKIWYTINGISYEHIEDMNREDAIETTDAPNEVYVGESWDPSAERIDEVTELDNIVKYLKRCRHIGQNVYVNFYGHKLYSCDVTTRDAYLEVYGVTKEELIELANMLPSKSINTIFENIQKINNSLKGVNAQIQKLDNLAKYFWSYFKKIPATYMSSGKTENDNTLIEKNSDSEEISIAEAIEQAQNDAKFRVQKEKEFITRLDELKIQQIILDVYSRFSERLTELTKEETQEIPGLQEKT